jgi:hypothetical protein
VIVYTQPNEGDFCLEEGSNIFVNVAKTCDFFPLVLIQELKLVPFVYQGLEELAQGLTSSIHIEAKTDLQKCQVFVLVLPLSARGRIGERAWGLAEFDLSTRAGMKGFLYFPLVENIPESKDVSMDFFLPPYATIRNAPDCESLNDMLKQDLLRLMRRR